MFIMFDCVLFDFDGTLVSFSQYVNWERACRRIVDLYIRKGLPKEIFSKYLCNPLSLVSHTNEELLKILPKEKALRISEEALRILDAEEFEALPKATIIAGCEEVLRWLRRQGVHVGVVSPNSGQIVSYLLRRHQLRGFVEAIVGRDPRLKIKPYPEQVLSCLERLGCRRERTAFITVDEDGIKAAKASGVHAIVVLSGSIHSVSRLLDAKTDSIVEDFKALLALFQQLC
jgi:putative hydrolase of the HAD superfamily